MNNLEQIALRVAKESKLNEFMWLDESIETFTDEVVAVTDFARRLVAALGAAEPVAWQWEYYKGESSECHGLANRKPPLTDAWPLYAAPRITLDLSSAPPQLPQREGWQPIETAPKDGAKVLLARCGKNEAGTDLGVWWACKGFWSSRWNNWNDGVEPCGLAHPTHWMPLPDAPNV